MHFIFSFLTHKHLCHLPVKLKTEGVNLIVKAHGVTIVLKTLFFLVYSRVQAIVGGSFSALKKPFSQRQIADASP